MRRVPGISPEVQEILNRFTAVSGGLATGHALLDYQNAIGRTDVLGAHEQGLLVRQVRESDAARATLQSDPPADFTELRRLQGLDKVGKRCEEILAATNFRIIRKIAGEKVPKTHKQSGASAELDLISELVQEGNVVLLKAIREWNPQIIASFPTFVTSKIRFRLTELGNTMEHGSIKVENATVRTAKIAHTVQEEFRVANGRLPNLEELRAAILEKELAYFDTSLTDEQRALSEEDLRAFKMAKLRKSGMLRALQDLPTVLQWSSSTSSLDQPVGDGAASLGDLIASSPASDATEAIVLGQELRRTIREALDALPERDRDIIEKRFAFDGGPKWVYSKLAERWGLSNERVRQIEKQVLTSLKIPEFEGMLRDSVL